ncbi:serine/threonine-protein kinase OSR1-like isoform X3 [Carica papaya]|uniref:serine/threonine-protein kinase OSR1-like isoform X3 n=1 Tax=Carica papaya TaxID=3649 RepID=UPI000B8D0C92|nr:serine/threonine-protein kinase OSR1-like isoform X3 [Carica papaya]
MANSSTKRFPVDPKDYELYEEVGEGVSATVYRALCIPLNEVVAIKVLDLERCRNDLESIRREVQLMTLIDNPNLLKAHCSFMAGSSLWIVMPYMAGGSCLHIMRSAHPEGFEQPVIATLLREVLKALVYLHAHGNIHRDVKAGNILVDSKGAVKLGDFGVSACMFDNGDRLRARNTFAGTPCWMAPEVMQQLNGYDFKADIWSFGITALELAHGHAPFSKYPPMKVLLMTLQNAPPGLDYERDKKFSKSFKEIVAACLVKDPKKRPTSAKLLKHSFFKHARSSEFLARKMLGDLCPLGDRFRMLKEKEADLLLQNKGITGDKEHLSQQEYMRGISAWNFDLDEMRKQAALIQDDDISNVEDQDLNGKATYGSANLNVSSEHLLMERSSSFKALKSVSSQEFQECLPAPNAIHFLQALDRDQVDVRFDDIGDQKVPSSLNSEEPVDFFSIDGSPGRNRVNSDTSNALVNQPSGQPVNSVSSACASLLPSLQSLVQQTAMQNEQLTRLIRYVDQATGGHNDFTKVGADAERLQVYLRERDLQAQLIYLQQSVGKLTDELQRQKTANAQLKRQFGALSRLKSP